MLQLTTIFFLITFSMLAVLHSIALHFSLYWYFPWFDMVMHTFGGAVVSLGFYTLRDIKLFPKKYFSFKTVIFLLLCIAISWEVFEVTAGIMVIDSGYWPDTVSDLVCGLTGGVVGYYVGKQLRSLRYN